MSFKIASFNVNSIKMRLPNLLSWLDKNNIDVILMQETKTMDDNFPSLDFKQKRYNVIFNGQKSYNGVAIASKFEINEINRSLPFYSESIDEDNQARFLHVKINDVNIICLYLPNGNPAPGPKYEYKLSWMKRLIKYTKDIYDTNEPLILGGDFNVIQESIDCYDISKWQNDALYLETTRRHLRELINIGLVDAYRIKYPTAKEYSFWDYQGGAWQKDNGIRIDLFLISPEIVDNLNDVGIDKTPRGEEKPSDHTPVWIELKN